MRSRAALGNHPLHPALVTIPIGAFALTLIGDIAYVVTKNPAWYEFSKIALCIGVISALVAAVAGFIDYFGVKMSAAGARLARTHMILNLVGVVLFAVSWWLRGEGTAADGQWPLAFGLSTVAFLGLGASGWIGGKMVFEHKIGVVENRDPEATEIGKRESAS